MNAIEKFVEKLPFWLRWILVLPLALIAAYIVWYVLFNLMIFALPSRDSIILFFNITILECAQILSNAYFCWCFLYFSYAIAPSHKTETLIVLAIISSVFISAPIVVGVIHGRYPIFSQIVLSDIVYIVVSAYACCKIPEHNLGSNKSCL